MKPILAIACVALTLPATLLAQSFVNATPADEAAIRAIVASQSADKEDPQVAPDLDWENAFGIRYTNLAKRNHWFNANIKQQFKDASNDTLEVRVRFISATTAVADEYWHVAGQVYAGETKPGADRWGRTTYIFKKENSAWIEVMERVADLRSPYFKHYDAVPASVPVAPAVLASYAGKYATPDGNPFGEITAAQDHLAVKTPFGAFSLIPTSATEFLAFNPDDLAQYYKVTFTSTPGSANASPTTTLAIKRADDKPLATASKLP